MWECPVLTTRTTSQKARHFVLTQVYNIAHPRLLAECPLEQSERVSFGKGKWEHHQNGNFPFSIFEIVWALLLRLPTPTSIRLRTDLIFN
jgi:hypothetical protein